MMSAKEMSLIRLGKYIYIYIIMNIRECIVSQMNKNPFE